MSLIKAGVEILKEEGPVSFFKRGSGYAWKKSLSKYHRKTGKSKSGTPVFERDWDALVIYDACRLDLMRQVSKEYDWSKDIEKFRSLGSSTDEWMRNNFKNRYPQEKENTVMIASNPYAGLILDESNWMHIEKVWEYADWRENGTVLPQDLTDAAIRTRREYPDADRYIIHYLQPHVPFVQSNLSSGIDIDNFGQMDTKKTVWQELRDGNVEEDEVWSAYQDNLQIALDDVDKLVNNFEADKMVISSDHGNALGEVPFIYGHPPGVSIDALRNVPWFTLSAEDRQTYQPETKDDYEIDTSTDELLENLGYKS